MKINQLSGDSSVKNVALSNGTIEVIFKDSETDDEYSIKIQSPSLYSEGFNEEGSVHVRIERISDFLPIDNKSLIYHFPEGFGNQMKLKNIGFHTAIGLRSMEYPYMLSIMGYKRLLVCPIKNINEILIDRIK